MDVLRNQIVKAYVATELHISKWDEVVKNGRERFKVLKNLKARLEHTVRTSIDEELGSLHATIEELGQLNSSLRNLFDSTYKVYSEHWASIHSHPSFYGGTSVSPPVSTMLEWMDDIITCYATMLLKLRCAVEMFNYSPGAVADLDAHVQTRDVHLIVDSIVAKMYSLANER